MRQVAFPQSTCFVVWVVVVVPLGLVSTLVVVVVVHLTKSEWHVSQSPYGVGKPMGQVPQMKWGAAYILSDAEWDRVE